jgi:non-ribosomal peptide synthase protein (TIGR01720 family)
MSLAEWYSTQQVRVDVELHGREAWFAHDDLSQTVGWLTAAVPVQLTLPQSNDPHDVVPSVKDQLRTFTRFAVAFGALRWLTDDPELQREFRDGFGSQISFNYLGRLDRPERTGSIFKLATDHLETSVDPRNPRWHMLDLIGFVRRDQLQLQLTYHPDVHQIDRITQLFEQFTKTLTNYIESLSETRVSSPTPSDYPYADLSAQELATVLARLQHQQSARSSV